MASGASGGGGGADGLQPLRSGSKRKSREQDDDVDNAGSADGEDIWSVCGGANSGGADSGGLAGMEGTRTEGGGAPAAASAAATGAGLAWSGDVPDVPEERLREATQQLAQAMFALEDYTREQHPMLHNLMRDVHRAPDTQAGPAHSLHRQESPLAEAADAEFESLRRRGSDVGRQGSPAGEVSPQANEDASAPSTSHQELPSVLSLNVGGQIFRDISRDLLCSVPGSQLAHLFSGRGNVQFYKGSVFLDRNPRWFEHVLRWLRFPSAQHVFPDLPRFRREMELYGLASAMFKDTQGQTDQTSEGKAAGDPGVVTASASASATAATRASAPAPPVAPVVSLGDGSGAESITPMELDTEQDN